MKQTKIIAIIVALLILCPLAGASIGIRIAPASITISDALRGGTYEQTITVFNTGDSPGTFTLAAEGECSDWISFYKEEEPDTPIKELKIAAKDHIKVIVKFDIPSDAENRNYTSTIYVQSTPKNITGEGGAIMGAMVRIPQNVLIKVTGTQILQGTVKSITTADTEIGYPLKIKVEFQNEGNVVAKPKIAICIKKDGELVDSFVHDATGIKPGKTDIITVLWNTTGRDAGDYTASVNVSLGEEALATSDLPFKILPLGTLTRKGELKSLSVEGEPLVNRVVKVVASFENIGKIDTRAKFKGELYCDGAFVDILEGDERLVEVGESINLVSYYKIRRSGDHLIKGAVIYDGKETEVKEVSFTVPEPKVEEEKQWIPGFYLLLALITIIIIFACLKWRKK